MKRILSFIVLLAMVVKSIAISGGLVYLQQYLESQSIAYAALFCHVLMALAVPVSCCISHKIAVALNEFENHKTDTQYDECLTFKCKCFPNPSDGVIIV